MDNTEILKWNQKSKSQKHHFFLPSPSLRALIIGSSNCGKTCLLLKTFTDRKMVGLQRPIHIFKLTPST